MTVNAAYLYPCARLCVEYTVAVRVVAEVTVNTVHPFLQVYVLEVNGGAFGKRVVRELVVVAVGECDRLLQHFAVDVRDNIAVTVQKLALAVALEDGAENPAVAVEVRELRSRELPVELRRARLVQEFFVGPQAAQG